MIWFLVSFAMAQTPANDRFEQYCDQLAADVPVQQTRSNGQVNSLMAVADSAQQIPARMRAAVRQQKTYAEFKAESLAKNINITDSFHSQAFERIARAQCELSTDAMTESSAGDISTQAHSHLTPAQDLRRINDVEPPSADPAQDGGGTESVR